MSSTLNNYSRMNNLRIFGGIQKDYYCVVASAYVLEKRIIRKLKKNLTLEIFLELKPLIKRRPSTYSLERLLVYLVECVEKLNIQQLTQVQSAMNSDFKKGVLMITGKWLK